MGTRQSKTWKRRRAERAERVARELQFLADLSAALGLCVSVIFGPSPELQLFRRADGKEWGEP